MPAAKQHVVLHNITVRVDEETGEEKSWAPGDVYTGPAHYIPRLMGGKDDPAKGPLIAEKASDEAKTAQDTTSKGN